MLFKTINNVILHDDRKNLWLRFHSPKQVIEIKAVDKIVSGLKYIEEEVNNRGLHAAGFLSYEAGPAFDNALKVNRQKDAFPLMWFGLYGRPDRFPFPKRSFPPCYLVRDWRPSIRFGRYENKIETIKDCISAGATYQVNYTFKLATSFSGDAWGFFSDLVAGQQAGYPAFVDIGRYAICSASPELFFSLNKNRLVSRPMKGTAARGCTTSRDIAQSRWLASSDKNRAENLMIVDMMRNDMGRVAEPASVCVPRLFDCERFPTVWQMTSTVACTTGEPVAAIMAALFPCASITGAPKASTMGIISRLETKPRGLYTGCIGYIAPRRSAQFNVAIRTAVIDKKESSASYGVGGGIVWQSDASQEYDECRAKAKILTARFPEFSLLETMLWTPQAGYFLFRRHLARLTDSVSYFGFRIDMPRVRLRLSRIAQSLPRRPHRVRLLVEKNGAIRCETSEIGAARAVRPMRLALAKRPIDSLDCFLYHKTTNRAAYERALAQRKGFDDVLLYNEKGEITETCFANVVVEINGKLLTPKATCGLLGGTFRAHLLARHVIREGVIDKKDIGRATAMYCINSVRKWRKVITGNF